MMLARTASERSPRITRILKLILPREGERERGACTRAWLYWVVNKLRVARRMQLKLLLIFPEEEERESRLILKLIGYERTHLSSRESPRNQS